MENPYPKDVFIWDSPEKLDFNRGRFNQHCFEVWENCRDDILKLINEMMLDMELCYIDDPDNCVDDDDGWIILNKLKQEIEDKIKPVEVGD